MSASRFSRVRKGDAAARGALWGADIALTSDSLGAAVELLIVSRELFGTFYSIFFWITASALQLVVLAAALAVAVPRRCSCKHSKENRLGLPPSCLHVLTLVCVNGLTLLWISTQVGDDAYWTAAPCRCRYTVALLQVSTMAFVGLVGGLACGGHGWWPLGSRSTPPVMTQERLGGILTLYVLYANLFLTMNCASPVRTGWRFWRQSRLHVVLALAAAYGLYMCWSIDAHPSVAACLCGYCGVVAVLQDMAKLMVHGIFDCLKRCGNANVDEVAAASLPRATTNMPSCDPACRRSSVSFPLDAVVGCIASLDAALLCRARPAPIASTV